MLQRVTLTLQQKVPTYSIFYDFKFFVVTFRWEDYFRHLNFTKEEEKLERITIHKDELLNEYLLKATDPDVKSAANINRTLELQLEEKEDKINERQERIREKERTICEQVSQ